MTEENDESGIADGFPQSERVLALILELDASLHEGRIANLPAERLSELTPDECRQLEHARQQLHSLYNASRSRRARGRRLDRAAVHNSPLTLPLDESEFGVNDALKKFLGIEGARFGRFEILRELGIGGHGVVFLARDPVLDRLVALKVPKPDVLINPPLRRRFLAEGRAAGILTHPNIVTVFESNEVGSICYLAQDYIPGPTLAQWQDDHPGPAAPRVAALFFLQLADAVSFAHSNQILHRDIKPANILLAPPPNVEPNLSLEKFSPKLADFGMAKMKQIAPDDSTRSGAILGTPAYMSPEQAAGHIHLVNETSDIYSLGAVLYELLTHVRASKGHSAFETLHRVIDGRLQSPRQLIRGFPRDLDAICMKCLSREQSDRYPTAQALADDLRRFSEGRPVLVRPQSTLVTLARWGRRNPIAALQTTFVACSVLIMLIGSLWYNARLQRTLDIVRQHERDLQIRTDSLRRRVYADDLRQAADAWEGANLVETRERLEACIPKPGETDLRSFPWWTLLRESENTSRVIGSLAVGSTTAPMVIDAERMILYCGEADGVIRARLLPDGKLLYELRGHAAGQINAMQLALVNKTLRLVSAGDDGTIRIWDLNDRREIRPPSIQEGRATAVRVIGKEGEAIASGSDEGLIRIWNTGTGQLERQLTGHHDVVRSFDEHAETGVLFSTAQDETVRVWDWRQGRPDARLEDGCLALPDGASWGRVLALSPDGTKLAVGFRSGKYAQWDVAQDSSHFGEVIEDQQFFGGIRALGWVNNATLALGAADSRLIVRRMKPAKAAVNKILLGHTDWILSLAIHPQTGEIITASKDGTLRFWSSNAIYGQFRNTSEEFERKAPPYWSGPYLTITLNNEVSVYEIPQGRLVSHFHSQNPLIGTCAMTSPDGRYFFTSEIIAEKYYFSAFECQTGQRRWKLSLGGEFGDEVTSAGAWADDGHLLLLSVKEYVLGVDAETGVTKFLAKHPRPVNEIGMIPGSSRFISLCMDGRIRFWDSQSGEQLEDRPGHQNSAQRLSISIDGKIFATSGEDLFVRIWSTDDGQQLAAFTVDVDLDSIDLVDEGRTLITLGSNGMRFWSVPDRIETARWKSSGVFVNTRMSPDRQTIVLQNALGLRLIRGVP
ncbi:protein kinase domain-containing protein [Schlesneria paludicola]|uniref:protein kinase domain-containing protein n=1 Tax=Schlesneria paludicola TaxID=360056 RepID=UPI00029AFFEA|nr:protein kinase [Schlesneria paludicola]